MFDASPSRHTIDRTASSAPSAEPPFAAASWTYLDLALTNLSDLLGPVDLVNPRINVICAYAEIEKLFSNLLPQTYLCELAGGRAVDGAAGADDPVDAFARALVGVEIAIRAAARDCNCHEELTVLHEAASRARRHERTSTSVEELRAAVDTAATFMSRLPSLSYRIGCACTAPMTYCFRDGLDVCPPCELRLTCAACSRQSIWFVPSPRQA